MSLMNQLAVGAGGCLGIGGAGFTLWGGCIALSSLAVKEGIDVEINGETRPATAREAKAGRICLQVTGGLVIAYGVLQGFLGYKLAEWGWNRLHTSQIPPAVVRASIVG